MSSAAGTTAGPASGLGIVDLQRISGRELDPLLLEETVEWERDLDWDFSPSASLIRRYTANRALAGAALIDRAEVAGYGYAVIEETRALIGDLFVRPLWRAPDTEAFLYRTILDGLTGVHGIHRIESQLMGMDLAAAESLTRERGLHVTPRLLMLAPLPQHALGAARSANGRFRIEHWSDHHEEQAASVITLAYAKHVDSAINEQYRSLTGARRFLHNIIRYPGCGSFFKPASLVAFDRQTGWLAGIALVSFVARTTGHLTQLCVVPGAQGLGLGRELLGSAMDLLRQHGAQRASLTVTEANAVAVGLYRQAGFRSIRRFPACVWERG